MRTETNLFCLYFVILGVVSGITMFLQVKKIVSDSKFDFIIVLKLQMFAFGYAGEKLTVKIRTKTFESMLKQEIGWYDRKENAVGPLCAQLSSDASSVQGVKRMKSKFFLLYLMFSGCRHSNWYCFELYLNVFSSLNLFSNS